MYCLIKNKIIKNIKKNLQKPKMFFCQAFFVMLTNIETVPFLKKQSIF